jgi:quinol monooxygenase YgiN
MYMRLVQTKVKPDGLERMKSYYDEEILPLLQQTAGCLYAGLMQSALHPEEILSMTLWDSQSNADMYEQSGLFGRLMEGAKPFFAESSEWRIQLTKEMTLEYVPVPDDPTVLSYAVSVASDTEKLAPEGKLFNMYLRIVSVKLKPGKLEEYKRVYESEIIPALRATKGCRHAYLTTPKTGDNEAISVTVWESRVDADAYEQSGLFSQLLEKTKHLYSELFQWKMHLDNLHRGQAATSEDLQVHGYTVVTGRSFQ